ncbi:TIGR04282 family arsenosugar biosynthesis glycosyltransferase [Pseudooceanicola onchidii]|uniref:TIGR04282 family arsenosugar biosynthesis glycosyltransferase n=1 Tax=Pseudooceanicola onchidii TaxID=2562279 RepID=UPI0010AA4021|nr:TIGR04282 family arsenosugar biosynthesis glycosyltransferase [Pseudooceanicola onchidii]
MRRRLVVMVKDPRAGRVKTRLGRDIGVIPATWWMRHQLRSLLRRLRDPRWEVWLAIAPDGAVTSRAFPGDLPRVAQGAGDLGDRMGRILRHRIGPRRPGPTLIIGADIPGITPAHIWRAFRALGSHDAVVGPAPDGGYWLIGMAHRPPPPSLFDGVRWSTAHALADTRATLPGWRIATVDTLADVDTSADL